MIVVALVLAGVTGWVTRIKGAGGHVVAPGNGSQIDTLREMSKAKGLPSPRYDLY